MSTTQKKRRSLNALLTITMASGLVVSGAGFASADGAPVNVSDVTCVNGRVTTGATISAGTYDGTLWFGSMRDRGADEAFEQQQPFLRSMRLGRRQCDPFSHGEPRAFLRACLVETDLALRSGQQDMEATLEVAVQIENRVVARLP